MQEEEENENTSYIRSQEDNSDIDDDIRRPGPVLRILYKHREAYPSLAAVFSAVSVGSIVSWTSGALFGILDNPKVVSYPVTKLQFNLSVSLLPMGAALGAMFSGAFAQSLGRKLALQCMTLPSVLSWVMLLLGSSMWWIYVARILGGIAMGIVYTTAIVYIAEICRPSIRGIYCALVQVGFTLGVLYTCAVNVLAKSRFYPVTAACLPLPFIAALLMQQAPETPQFFVHTHQYVKAVQSLQRLRGIEEDIEDEFDQLKNIEEEQNGRSMFKQKTTRKALYITAGLMAFHHLSGIYTVTMNLEEIAAQIGVFSSSAVTALVIAAVMLLFACIGAGIVDKVGRKILLYVSLGTMFAMALVLLVSLTVTDLMNVDRVQWISFLCLMVYACAFSLGIGPLPWVIMGEVIPQKFHSSACGVVSAVGWLICTLTSASYSVIESVLINCGLHSFFCLMGLIYIRIVLPETMGYTLDEIHEILQS